MKVSVITPSIRPEGLNVVRKSLAAQTSQDFEWLPMLSLPKDKSTLCRDMNDAVRMATGDIIVFIQDWISFDETTVAKAADVVASAPKGAFTFPVGKRWENEPIKYDWRWYPRDQSKVYPHEWEIDFGACHKQDIVDAGLFDEDFDRGFGWENVDLAERMAENGVGFFVSKAVSGVAFDHDRASTHPWKKNPNDTLCIIKREMRKQKALLKNA